MRPRLTIAITAYDSFDNVANTVFSIYQQYLRLVWEMKKEGYRVGSWNDIVQVLVRNDNPELDDRLLVDVCDWCGWDYAKNEKNIGESRSRQLNLLDADGLYMTWIDADDNITPDYLETILDETKAYPEADIIMHRWHFIDGREGDQHPKPLANWNVWANVYKTDVVRDIQFDPLQVYSSDYYWLEKAVKEKNPKIYYSDKSVNIYNDGNYNSLTHRFQRGEIKARLDE